MSPSPRACPVGGAWPGIIEAYREHLPVTEATPVVTLQEGGTPLVPAVRLSEALGQLVDPTVKAVQRGVGAAAKGVNGTYLVSWTDAFFFGSEAYGLVNELE